MTNTTRLQTVFGSEMQIQLHKIATLTSHYPTAKPRRHQNTT